MTDAHGKILGGALFASAAVARVRGARHEEWIT